MNNEALLNAFRNSVGRMDFCRSLHIASKLLDCHDVPGDIVEFGCNEGDTALFMSLLSSKPLWLYDSFEGLPKPSEFDATSDEFKEGAMSANLARVVFRFYPQPQTDGRIKIIKGWFKDIKPEQLPEKIAFAHLDGDWYESIRDSLNLVWLIMSRGGCVVVDDYEGLPGVKKAVDEFLKDRGGSHHGFEVTKSINGDNCVQCCFYKSA